jgi:serine/threonine protein kinase
MKLPSKIGRYEIDRLLGQGAMGAVYLGKDPSLDRLVAIKMVKDLGLEETAKKRFLDRFRNEARAAGRLSHPSIVQVYDVGEDPDVGPYLVFEYVKGSSLKELLREKKRLEPRVLLSLCAQLGDALDVAHAAGIIHRDVKPDNVLVGEDGRAKLADFGIARVPDAALTKEGQFLGTPCYAAPETLAEGRYGPRTDQFSFAVMTYELICGRRAFPGEDAITVAHAVLHDHPLPPSEAGDMDLPEAVDEVVLRGMAKDDKARFANASEFVRALEAAYAGAGIVSMREGTGPRPIAAIPSESKSSWVWLVGLLILALVGGGVLATTTPCTPVELALDDAGVEVFPDASRRVRERPDAATRRTEGPDARDEADAAVEEVPDAFRALSQREIEDLAKDEIDAARAAVERGDVDGARTHLRRARELDPESSDLSEVEALIDAQ